MRRIRTLLLAFLLLSPCTGELATPKDKLLESRTFTGVLQGFRWGDYLHAEFKDQAGNSQSLFVNDTEACFMARHARQALVIEYNKVSRYFEQGDGYFPADDIVQIKAGDEDYQRWRKTFDSKRDFEACEALIENHTIDNPHE